MLRSISLRIQFDSERRQFLCAGGAGELSRWWSVAHQENENHGGHGGHGESCSLAKFSTGKTTLLRSTFSITFG